MSIPIRQGPVWNHLKKHGMGKRIVKSCEELNRVVIEHLRFLQKSPDLIRAFFHDPHVRYVTDTHVIS